jgi:hypothetical protein
LKPVQEKLQIEMTLMKNRFLVDLDPLCTKIMLCAYATKWIKRISSDEKINSIKLQNQSHKSGFFLVVKVKYLHCMYCCSSVKT